MQISENLLVLINRTVQPHRPAPPTGMSRAWDEKDKSRFRQDHERWKSILSRPPYKKP